MAINNNIVVALTGFTGAVGSETAAIMLQRNKNIYLKLLIRERVPKFAKGILKKYKDRVEVVKGSLEDKESIKKLIEGASYFVNIAGVIPPKADHDPQGSKNANYIGVKNIISAVKESKREEEVKLIHFSTVAVYGNRDYHHPWARYGDPVMSSDYDYYSMFKIKGEREVLESGLPYWCVLRETAVYHKYFLVNNMHDGLMFHTPWNAPFEWLTDRDSGRLVSIIIEEDSKQPLKDFWKKGYNMGGGKSCRDIGIQTFDKGFALMGATTKDIFEPNWNINRNFHGVWFADSYVLEERFHYRSETIDDFWKRMAKYMWYYKFACILPKFLIKAIFIKPLLKNSNAPLHWLKSNNDGRISAFWGSKKEWESIPKKWSDYPRLDEGKTIRNEDIDFNHLIDEKNKDEYKLNHGYDESKKDSELDINDFKMAAQFRGGKLLSTNVKKGDLYTKLEWQCADGHKFMATPFTVLKAGFWCPECFEPLPFNLNNTAKKSPFHSQVYFDTHTKEDDGKTYPLSKNDNVEVFTKSTI